MSFYYLAVPYNSKRPDSAEAEAERLWRVEEFWRAVAHFIRTGYHVQSPMSLIPAVLANPDLPSDWAYWAGYSTKLIESSTMLVVLCLPGWEESTGVQGELTHAREYNIPIKYMTPETDGTYSFTEPRREPIDYRVRY